MGEGGEGGEGGEDVGGLVDGQLGVRVFEAIPIFERRGKYKGAGSARRERKV